MSDCGIRSAVVTVNDPAELLVAIRAIAEKYSTHIILFNQDRMAGRRHAEAALAHAARSCREQRMIARTFEMEALLYAAGSRQCTVGRGFGIHEGENHCYVCLCPEKPEVWDALDAHMTMIPVVEEMISSKKRAQLMKLFSITESELAMIGEERLNELVLERVALLEVYR
jgi:KEOPS complex subunit Cgi121